MVSLIGTEPLLLTDWELELNADRVLRAQGANPQIVRQRRPALVETAEWALQEGRQLLETAVLCREFEVEAVRHERLHLAGGGLLSGRLIAQHLSGAERVVVGLCTVGSLLDEVVSELLPEDPSRGLALDAVGTAAIEELSARLCGDLGDRAARFGLHTSIPLSPGMVGWTVEHGQPQVFALLDGASIGVRLNESLMMIPQKSISLVVGASQHELAGGRTCDYCAMQETCRYQDHYL